MHKEENIIEDIISQIADLKAMTSKMVDEIALLREAVSAADTGATEDRKNISMLKSELARLTVRHDTIRDASDRAFSNTHHHLMYLLRESQMADERLHYLEVNAFPEMPQIIRQIDRIIGDAAPTTKSDKFDRRD